MHRPMSQIGLGAQFTQLGLGCKDGIRNLMMLGRWWNYSTGSTQLYHASVAMSLSGDHRVVIQLQMYQAGRGKSVNWHSFMIHQAIIAESCGRLSWFGISCVVDVGVHSRRAPFPSRG